MEHLKFFQITDRQTVTERQTGKGRQRQIYACNLKRKQAKNKRNEKRYYRFVSKDQTLKNENKIQFRRF